MPRVGNPSVSGGGNGAGEEEAAGEEELKEERRVGGSGLSKRGEKLWSAGGEAAGKCQGWMERLGPAAGGPTLGLAVLPVPQDERWD